jgi:plasmid rolling circle replication initiator protein Rep
MANIGHISPQVVDEISQNFNTLPLCSYLETFDTTPETVLPKPTPKKWDNKQRRKFTSDVVATRCKDFELLLPKDQRGSWNSKIARQYVPDIITPETLPWEDQPEYLEFKKNKYGEPIFVPTDEERQPDEYYNLANNTGNQLRWKRVIECHSSIREYTDSTTGKTIYKATKKCNDKLCLLCSQIRSRVAIIKYQDKVNEMIDPVMVVLHQKSPGIGQLKNFIDKMYQDWRSIMKVEAKSKNESMSGILALEVTTNDIEQTYHPHYHIIIEKRHAVRLVNLWVKKDPENRKLNAHRNKKTWKLYTELEKDETGKVAIHELFKYAMKMSVTNEDKPGETQKTIGSTEMIYEIAKSLRGVQQWRPFGEFRKTPNTKEIIQVIQDEMSVSREDHPHIELSKEWNWNGMDWEAYDMPGMTLVGKRVSDGSIVYLRLTKEEYNTFVNDKRNQPKRSHSLQVFETPGEDSGIQEIPGSETIERSIYHHKQPSP